MGSLVSAQFGQKLRAGELGKTYTFAARVKALDGPVVVRLEVERAGRPWDRAARGPDLTVRAANGRSCTLPFQWTRPIPRAGRLI